MTHKFRVGEQEGYITVGLYDDGHPGEIFVNISKEGSTIRGLMDSVAVLTSVALQYGVPLENLVAKFRGVHFEPNGLTSNPAIPTASSLVDYIFRWLELRFLRPPANGGSSAAKNSRGARNSRAKHGTRGERAGGGGARERGGDEHGAGVPGLRRDPVLRGRMPRLPLVRLQQVRVTAARAARAPSTSHLARHGRRSTRGPAACADGGPSHDNAAAEAGCPGRPGRLRRRDWRSVRRVVVGMAPARAHPPRDGELETHPLTGIDAR